ncbi:MAG: hypothetical protein KDC87_20190, partial [Planctomycetes bacterium]|nr:hypothetical protein [Planctomycetota bacterium]
NNENINVNATRANHTDVFGGPGARGNGISSVPHPNPPRLLFPPPNPSQAIFAEEPTANPAPPNGTGCVTNPIDLLVSGNPDGPPALGLFGHVADVFNGPAPRPGSPPPPTPSCPFSYRQQIGHFLYVLDTDNKKVLVLNSNRMTVLDQIRLPDPVDCAMAPNLRRLAVTNFSSGSVSFIDTDPTSSTFHQIVSETRVPPGPGAVAWQTDGEDILVVHPESSQLTVIGGIDFQVIKTVSGFLDRPIGIVTTHRMNNAIGNATGLYHAYILNSNGTVAVWESGPDGVNGIGFNDIIGTIPEVVFRNPRKMGVDNTSQMGGAFVSHVDEFGNGQVSRFEMTSSPGQVQLNPNTGGFLLPPTFRQKEWKVTQTYGGFSASNPTRDLLSGRAPGEMAADEMYNLGDLPGQTTQKNSSIANSPSLRSVKDTIKFINGTPFLPYNPRFLFIALTDRGVIDVFDIGTAEKVRVIELGGTPSVVSAYWRQ